MEIVSSESDYNRMLSAVKNVYFKPLNAALRSNRAIISNQNLQIIFTDVLQILQHSQLVFNYLRWLNFDVWSYHIYCVFMPSPFEEWWRGIKCYPCPCVRACVRLSEIWCPLNNLWKTASIQFKFGMLIYNINTQVKFDFGNNPLSFDGVMGLL